MTRIPLNEGQWTDVVVQTAKLYGWVVSHFRPAKTERGWRTPVQGDNGFPDLALARDCVVLLAELKTDKGKLRPEQERWRDAIGPEHYRLWRPADLPKVIAELRHPVTPTGPSAL